MTQFKTFFILFRTYFDHHCKKMFVHLSISILFYLKIKYTVPPSKYEIIKFFY